MSAPTVAPFPTSSVTQVPVQIIGGTSAAQQVQASSSSQQVSSQHVSAHAAPGVVQPQVGGATAPAGSSGNSNSDARRRYQIEKAVGQGTFGTVVLAKDEQGQRVAIKRVLQDPRFKNRELQIMKLVNHPNVVALRDYYYTTHGERNEVFLNVVMEFVPETLHRCVREYARAREYVPLILVKCFMFQLLRSIGYLHLPHVNVCHRDIKPHNLLVDMYSGTLKICDFGSAKQLNPAEPNVAYICSRYYRAPELIFGCTHYTPAIDTWSVGCIFAEMLMGEPFFKGENNQQQLVEIIKVLGTPTREQTEAMTQRSDTVRLPIHRTKPWSSIFKDHVPVEAHDLCSRLLNYIPAARDKPFDAMCHRFFDELHDPNVRLPSGQPLPSNLFRFSQEEIRAMSPEAQAKLVKNR